MRKNIVAKIKTILVILGGEVNEVNISTYYRGRRTSMWLSIEDKKIIITADFHHCGDPEDYIWIHKTRTKDLANIREALLAKLGKKSLTKCK